MRSVRPNLILPEGTNLDGLVPGEVEPLNPRLIAQVDPEMEPKQDSEEKSPLTNEESEKPQKTKFAVWGHKQLEPEWGPGLPPSERQATATPAPTRKNRAEERREEDPALTVPRESDERFDKYCEHGSPTGKPQLAYLSADLHEANPGFPLSRQTEPDGRYYEATRSGGKYTAFANDYLVVAARKFTSLAREERICYDWFAPPGAVTKNKTSRGTAASAEFVYRANAGSSTSALDSRYSLVVRVFNERYPWGRVVLSKDEPRFLDSLKTFSKIAARENGDWVVNVTRNGELVSTDTIAVTGQISAAGWQRKVSSGFKQPNPALTAYQNDETVQYSASYPIPPFSGNSTATQSFEVKWDLRSPQARYNINHRHKYWSVCSLYKTDGTVWNITTTVADTVYRKPRIYQSSSGNGTLSTLNLSYGQGLPTYGSWIFTEKVGTQAPKESTLSVRELDSDVALVTPGLYVESGSSVPFVLSFNAYPESWTPDRLNWTLKLVDESGATVKTYSGNITGNTQSCRQWVQTWDGSTDAGSRVRLGKTVRPVLSVSIPDPSAPTRTARTQSLSVRSALSRFYRYTARLTSNYTLASQHPGYRAEFIFALPVQLYNDTIPGGLDVLSWLPEFTHSDGSGNYFKTVGSLAPANVTGPDFQYNCDGNGNIVVDFDTLRRKFAFGIDGSFSGAAAPDADNVAINVTDNLTGIGFQFKGDPNLELQQNAIDIKIYRGAKHVFGDPDAAESLVQFLAPYFDPPWTGIHRSFGVDFDDVILVILIDVESVSQGTKEQGVCSPSCECSGLCSLLTWLRQIGVFSSPVPIEVSNASGRYRHHTNDLSIPTRGFPLSVSRVYASEEQKKGPLFGWHWNFQDHLMIEPSSGTVYHIGEPSTEVHIFNKSGGAFAAADGDNTDRLTQVDDRHYQITTKGHTSAIYEVPLGVSLSQTVPYDAVLKSQSDNNGNTNTLTWDPQGKRLLKMEGPDSSQFIRFWWSTDNGPDKITDHTGRSVLYRYRCYKQPDTLGHEGDTVTVLSKVVQPGNKVYDFGYHEVLGEGYYQLLTTSLNGILQEKVVGQESSPGVLQEVTHRLGPTYAFSRDNSTSPPTSRVTISAADPSLLPQGQAQQWTYNLDDEDRVLSGTDSRGRSESVTYDLNHNVKVAVDSRGHEVVKQSFDARNNRQTITDTLGRTTSLDWNANDTLKAIHDAKGGTTLLEWDSHFNLKSVTDPAQHVSSLTYTPFGKPLTAKDNLGHEWSFSYDSLGFLKGKTAPPSEPGQPAAQWTYKVDSLGRRTEARDPLGRRVRFKFDVRDRLYETTVPAVSPHFRQECLPEGHIRAEFDNSDLLRATTALDGLKTTYDYDSAHRLIAVHTPGTRLPSRLKYDALEHVVESVNSNGQATNYIFDTLNRVKKVNFPGGSSESFTYDENNNVKTWDRGSYVVSYDYDDLNRLSHIASPTTGDDIIFTFDALDRVKTMTDNSGTTRYDYTDNYLLDSITRPGNKKLQYFYDDGDRLRQMQDPEGLTTDYRYSNRNELNSVTHDGKTVRYVHDLVGRTTLTQMPNGVYAQMAFSERDQLLFKSYAKGSDPLITLKYGFNQVGQRVVGEQIDATGSTLHRYCYNERRELTESSKDGPKKNQHSEAHYVLDQNDNITNNNGTTFKSNGADQLLQAGSTALGYNSAGQASTVGAQSLTFAYNDQIRSITAPGLNAQYLYDGNGQRVRKTVNGKAQSFLWNGSNIAKEYKPDGTVRADYQLGAGAKIDGKWQFYLSDIQGSTLGVADDTGKMIATWDYSDYGTTTQTSGDHGLYQPMLYTHCELDAETGFYHNRARHYAPKFGKFLARDPIASNNLYSYCSGDPINSEDPSGLQPPVTNQGVVPFCCDFSKPQTPQQKEGAAFATQQVAFYLVGGAVMRGIGYAGRAVFGSAPMVAAGTAGPTIASETAQAAISRTVFGSIMRRLGVVAVTDTGLETAGVYYGGNFFILGRLGLFSEGQAIITAAHELTHVIIYRILTRAGLGLALGNSSLVTEGEELLAGLFERIAYLMYGP